jgi:MoaA/NifB/PqqE/SkfB family radical SAM enzyme
MSALISIGALADQAAMSAHEIRTLPVLVVFPHNQCNCRCVMCDIWRIREAKELTPADLQTHLDSFRTLGVRWVVFSGGEPQLNEKWSYLAQVFRSLGSRVTLLTAGLLLKTQARDIAENVDDVIVSLDGPRCIHDSIRRVRDAFERLSEGVAALRQIRPDLPVRARCTVQRENCQSLCDVVDSAKEIGLNSISFLAADLTSEAFNRQEEWPAHRKDRVALAPEEIGMLAAEVEQLIVEYRADLDSGFIVESPQKLRRIVQHFRAHLGLAENIAPRCNAPWVSAVIEASGDVRPCFFHPVVGNIHRRSFADIVNSPEALRFRSSLDVGRNETCRQCVCSLYLPQNEDLVKQ